MGTSEPILINGALVSAAVTSILFTLKAFGLGLTADQESAVLGLVGAIVIPLGTWLLARRQTVTVHSANEAIIKASATEDPFVETFKVGQ